MSKIKIFGLGGLNEVGKNLYVIDVDNDLFLFDAGLKYADDRMLGIDYIIPNYDFIKENKERIKGLFVTHGHDNQIGAIPDILIDVPELKIYGTKYTVEAIKRELTEDGISSENVIEIKPHHKIVFGKNSIFPISLTHSVPDTVGYVLYTENGAIVYTGNFVFDASMSGSYKTDIGKLAYVGKQGVLCLMSESLYADKRGFTSPQHKAAKVFRETFDKYEGRIFINVFHTQLFRIQEILTEVLKTDRKIVIAGKRLENIVLQAIDMGYLSFDKNRLLNIHHLNDQNVVVLISDEREKPFSNIQRIVRGYDKFVKLTSDDTIIFATHVYEGMEKSYSKVLDEIAKLGLNIVIIASNKYLGLHASSEDLLLMIDLMKPKYYMPVIGEYRHLVENASLAYSIGMKEENVLLKLNGQVVTFDNGNLIDNMDKIKADDILIDGKTPGDIGELVLKDRESLSDNGIVIVTTTIDRATKKILAGPEILTRGFIYVKDNTDLIKEAAKISLEVINEFTKPNYIDFNKVKMGIRDKLGKYLYQETECKPMILIVLQEV